MIQIPFQTCKQPINDQIADAPPLTDFAASTDPDIMYFHEAMREPDKLQWIKAMEEEVRSHTDSKHWTLTPRSHVPEGVPVLPAVWAMRRKRRIATREIYKWKARLNIDGSKQVKGVNYWETYAPVASWPTVRLLLTMVIQKNWPTRQIDYVMAYTQADVEHDQMFMQIPKGFDLDGANAKDYVLKLNKNLYGQKQAGRVWNKHLVRKLKSIGFKQSMIDECVFYRGQCIYVLYTDDSILTGPTDEDLDQVIADMKAAKLDLTVEGDISDFLGVNIDRKPDGTIHLTQPHLIDSIMVCMRLQEDIGKVKNIPAAASRILKAHKDSLPHDGSFNYRQVIGKMLYLEKSTRPDIAYAVHQCARYASDPKVEHAQAVRWIARYLKGTRDKGLILHPSDHSFECFADADFAGNWDPQDTSNPDTARSRSGFIIKYAGCPVFWASKMQTEIALSTTEAEYIALSTALREVIPMMELIEEMRVEGFGMMATTPTVYCKVFEDNSGAVELATVHKTRPRTKHLNVKYHHFRQFVDDGSIKVQGIGTDEQQADLLTKPLSEQIFVAHRRSISFW